MNIVKNDKTKSIYRYAFWILLYVIWMVFYWKQCVINNSGDYYWHNQFAQWMIDGEMIIFYPGYHLVVGGISKLTSINIMVISAVVLSLMANLSIYITSCLIEYLSGNKNYWINIILATIVNIVQPIFTSGIRPGYSSGNGYISPTQAMCKPFVLLTIYIFIKMYNDNKWDFLSQLRLLFLLIITCIIKPIFAMAFIPAIGLLFLVDEIITDKKNIVLFAQNYIIKVWPLFITGLFLISQLIIYKNAKNTKYEELYSHGNKSKICFGFFYAWSMVVSNVSLSIVFAYFFPIVIFIVLLLIRKSGKIKNLVNDKEKNFIKITSIYGLISFSYMAFLYQDAGYERDCNFRNAWVITFLMVFLFCVILLYKLMIYFSFKEELKNISNNGVKTFFKNSCIIILPSIALLIHIVFGILLFAKNLLF